MDLREVLRAHSTQPISHQLLMGYLEDYKRPNDKIKDLKDKGFIETMKKGLYIAGPALYGDKPDPFLLANHLHGPSYISNETALSYYGLIPERVYGITSVTIKNSRKFKTPVGRFNYIHLELPYYAFGIDSIKVAGNLYALIASAEKAICDKIVTTSGLFLRSARSAYDFLIDDLRIEESNLKGLDLNKIKNWTIKAPKKDSLLMAIKMIEKL